MTEPIDIHGDSKTVFETLSYAIYSIMLRRGLFPTSSFKLVRRWGLMLHTASDLRLKGFMQSLLKSLSKILESKSRLDILLSVKNDYTKTVVERWQFYIRAKPGDNVESAAESENNHTIASEGLELQSILRAVILSSLYLPVLEGPHSFCIAFKPHTDDHKVDMLRWVSKDYEPLQKQNDVQFEDIGIRNYEIGTVVSYSLGI